MNRCDHAQEIKAHFTNARVLCEKLGLLNGATKQSGDGLTVLCPFHSERTGSCSVTRGPDGTVRFRCFGCDKSGDALHLIAAVHQLDISTQFKDVLLAAAEAAGLHAVIAEINGEKPYEKRQIPEPKPSEVPPERAYPAMSEVTGLYSACVSVTTDNAASGHLVGRKLDPDEVSRYDLARVLSRTQQLPRWAAYQGGTWRTSGHRMIVPMYDADGDLRSVRAWRIEGDAPVKRLPPSGCKATGLVLANQRARALLTERGSPCRILVVEGEPDYITAVLRWHWLPVFGLISGSWGPEFAARIPFGSEVVVMTHHDPAGDKYAELVHRSVRSRAQVIRSAA
jgi:hypothetical protein